MHKASSKSLVKGQVIARFYVYGLMEQVFIETAWKFHYVKNSVYDQLTQVADQSRNYLHEVYY